MRRFIVSVVMLLGLAANAGTFVTGNPSLPPPKVDKIPPPADTTRYITAADINSLWGAAFDLRAAINDTTQLIYFPPGGVSRSIPSRLEDVFSVKDYGATGNGTTDDGPFIATCLAKLPAGGGSCFLPAGTYRITSPIILPLNTTIEGEGGPVFGTNILADGTAAFRILGANYIGGFAFRMYLKNFTIQMVNTPSSTKMVEIDTAYSIELDHIRIHNLPDNSSVGVNVVNSNDVNLRKLTVYGVSGSTNTGVFVQGVGTTPATVKMLEPDIELVNWGVRAFGGAQVDLLTPYMERFQIGVDNQTATGRVSMFGGSLFGINSGTYCIQAIAGSHSTIEGTRLNPGSSTHTLYATAAGAIIRWYDDLNNILYQGVSTATGDVTASTVPTVSSHALNVRDFGAKGDGSTEDAPAFQAATAAACISLRAVFIPAGSYKVSSTINGCSQLLVFGEGVNSLIRSNITDGTPVLKFTNAQFWKLRDFAIGSFANLTNISNGTASPQNCTGVQGTPNSTRYEINNVRVWGMAIGYDITGWIGTLTNVWAQWDGIGLNGNTMNSVSINGRFESNNQDFVIVNSSGVAFEQFIAEGTNTNAVASTIDNSNAVTMVSPYFEGPGSGLLGRNAPFLIVGGTTIVQNFTITAGTFYSGGFNWGVPAISLDRVIAANIDATIGTFALYRAISTTANTKDLRVTANTNNLMPTNVGTDNSLQIGTAWNYWPNRRFDLWYRGWTSATNTRATSSLDTTNVRGTNALKITTQAGQNFNYHNLKLQGPLVTALRGKTLRLGVWMWVPNTAAYDESVWVTNPSCTTCMFPAIQLTSFNGSVQTNSPTDNHHTARGQWNFLVTELALQSDATQIQIFLYANDSSNNGTGAESVTIGSVTLTEATTPVSRQFNDSLVDSPLIPAIGVGGQMIATGSAIPTDVNQTYAVGDMVLNTAPAIGSPQGWINTVAGSPGTWAPLANVGAASSPYTPVTGRKYFAYQMVGPSDGTYNSVYTQITTYGGGAKAATPLATRLGFTLGVGSTSSTTSGVITSSAVTRPGFNPKAITITQPQTNTNITHWFSLDTNTGDMLIGGGGTMKTLSAASGSTSTTPFAGIYQDSRGTSGTKWLCCSGDGTNYSCIDTGVTCTGVTDYTLTVDLTTPSTLICTVNSTTVNKSTNLPPLTSDLKINWGAMNNTNAVVAGPIWGDVTLELSSK